jgi:hypothetical protein
MPKGPPFSKKEIEALVAAAPHYVDDPDASYNPNSESEVIAFWSKNKLPPTPKPGKLVPE